ncbi:MULTISPECIES: class I SAM-dependent methyltransferase [unclassified Beijerinckia]|uniref:class I SAM-dependent methyltransferase n=1 Tax=unclassified Beijerinckia TaxID=2638183 RepID=UPI001481B0BC|nr:MULTISPECIES: class I SAM-dependent methyltransferase [unclassified Beijerinckia]
MALVALDRAGVFNGTTTGLSFGSGQEPIIFAIAERVGHLSVTDLYSGDTIWQVAQTDNCEDFVLSVAHEGFDASRIDVRSMDMRAIAFPDQSFDFAYSISTFEHIGAENDFVQHLKEVKRVLRPGGVYVLTTELRIGGETHEIAGNYKFSLSNLLSLFRQAGLNPESVFDHRLTPIGMNEATELASARSLDQSGMALEQLIVTDTGGIMSLPALFVLRSEPYRAPDVIGMAETTAWLDDRLRQRTRLRFQDWTSLNPYGGLTDARSPNVDLWKDAGLAPTSIAFATSYCHFGDAEMEFRVNLAKSLGLESQGALVVSIMSWSTENPQDMQPLSSQTILLDAATPAASQLRFSLKPEARRTYSVYGLIVDGTVMLADVSVVARHKQ